MICIEVRRLIIAARESGMGLRDILKNYQIKMSTYYDLVKLYNETGDVKPRPHAAGRKPALNEEGLGQMKDLIDSKPDITLREIKESMGLAISLAAISKIIRNKLKYRYKKRRYVPVNGSVLT